MPLVFAFVASALIHVAALVGPGWDLPGTREPEPSPPIDAVLAKPAARAEPAPKPQAKPPVPKPRASTPAVPLPVAAASPQSVPAPSAEPMPAVATPPAPVAVPAPPPVPAVAAPQPAKTALPGKGRVRYVITRGEGGFVIGQSVHSWEHDGFRYRLLSLTETIGIAALFKPAKVLQASGGEITDAGIRPQEFRHERVGGTDTASFDWAARQVSYGDRREAIVDGTQDMLSMYYQLVLLAPTSGVVEMPIATGRKLETYRFEVLGEENLSLPAGERRAWRVRTKSGNDVIELWLATGPEAAARGLPLKIRIIDRKGEIFDQIPEELAGEKK